MREPGSIRRGERCGGTWRNTAVEPVLRSGGSWGAGANQKPGAGGEGHERNPLGERQSGPGALLVEAEELDHEPSARIEHQIPAENLTGRVGFANAPVEEGEDQGVGDRFVELGRVEWYVERRTAH